MPAENFFKEVEIPQQRIFEGVVLPVVLSPNTNGLVSSERPNLSGLTDAIKENKPWLETLLHKSGAVLFRGFPLITASDFNEVVEAFDFEELLCVGSVASRIKVVGRVSTANESPPDKKIEFHHEMAQVPVYPSKLFFFCEVEPGTGGETPLVLSHIVYKRMKEKHSEFVQKLEEHGVIYVRVVGEEDDLSSPIGRGWKRTFLTEDKAVAEERAAKLGIKLEWMENGVKTMMGPIPAIKFDKTRERKIWFNIMTAAYTAWKDARNDPEKTVTFGDGKPLPPHIIYDCMRILDEESVAIPWQKGDVLLIDNLAVLHSRKPFDPPRRILASLCK
ncbi:hypothetical protein ACH5RR_024453 [Cinchona calisaya]|uniref:TauD/TfdA-like domain-containing protein n=1 Tax=Cinchona calisaya TaxID=153742 RepID=A0ABD2YYT6_9GENT